MTKITWKIIDGVEWCCDEDNNRCSLDYWGSKKKAEKALKSLVNCTNCIDCSYCIECINCNYCTDCGYCTDCTDCSYCSYCSECSQCSYCSECSCYKHFVNKADVIPTIENIHETVYKAVIQEGALEMDEWHSCNTTHCRAGWIITLAGQEGKELEIKFGTPIAALIIYKASSSLKVHITDLYKTNEEALEDMRDLVKLTNNLKKGKMRKQSKVHVYEVDSFDEEPSFKLDQKTQETLLEHIQSSTNNEVTDIELKSLSESLVEILTFQKVGNKIVQLRLAYENSFDKAFGAKGDIEAITTQQLLDYFDIRQNKSFRESATKNTQNNCLIL